MKKILLMGNPNVGKSVLFSRLTGAHVIASNYPGTTVEFTKGKLRVGGEPFEIIDVPGTYSLDPTSDAERVATDMVADGDIIVAVMDATALERSLNLTLHLLKSGKPVVVALNMSDAARHEGIEIDAPRLEEMLGVPVVPTAAVRGEGIKELVDRLPDAKADSMDFSDENRWKVIGEVVEQCQKVKHRHHTFLEWLGDASVHPLTGLPIAVVAGLLAFWIIRMVGLGLEGRIFSPLFENIWLPIVYRISEAMGGEGFLHQVIVGQLVEGELDLEQSFGLLTTGLYVPIAIVLSYVFAFYLVLGVVEDIGYLPRLGVMLDTLMHHFGLHGLSIMPMLLGLGCNVPGAMATRLLEGRKERFIASVMMAIAVPCMAQLAMVIGLVGQHGIKGLAPVFMTLFLVWLGVGVLLRFMVKGETPEILSEMPPYRLPYWKAMLKKLWMRTKAFICEAVPFVLLGVVLMNFLYALGIVDALGSLFEPVITRMLGLPGEATGALIVGFLRKDVAVGMLAPLGLELRQLVVASVVLMIYFPCVATFIVLIKELGIKDMAKGAALMIAVTLVVGTALNFLLQVVY